MSVITSTEVTSAAVTSYAWLGAERASASVERFNGVETRRNRLSYPDEPVSRTFGSGGGAGTVATLIGSGLANGPSRYVRKTWTTAPTYNSNSGFRAQAPFAVTPGETITVSGYLRSSSPRRKSAARAKISWVGGAGDIVTQSLTLVAGQWTLMSATLTVPDGITQATAAIDLDDGEAWQPGETLDCTGLMAEATLAVRPYFDGSSVGSSIITTASTQPVYVLGYETSRASRNVFHDVIGRSDPDVTLMPASLRTGTLELLYTTEAAALEAERMHAVMAVLTLADIDVPSVGMTYVVDGTLQRRLDATVGVWTVSVPYREVRP